LLSTTQFAVLIPAYRPEEMLVELVRSLAQSNAGPIIVVDDGSGPEFVERFNQIAQISAVHLLRHAVNLGKGAALKSGINYFLCTFPNLIGLVTADADGQHAADDIVRVGAQLMARPETLILGTRQFDSRVPFRSRVGNQVSRALVRLLIGQRLSDTQTGLRGIPRPLLPHLLRISVSGYDFELEMLITAKHLAYPMREESVRTIYLEGNRTSHFNPILDSTRIYFILLRFGTLSLLTALVDNVVFFTGYHFTGGIGRSQILARVASVLFNYTFARRLVFLSKQDHRIVLPKYLLLVLCSGLLSYSLIRLLTSAFAMNVMPAKLLAEGLIFIANFTIQRDFVFTKRESTQ
jgi:glycosyltransferase involved in cell wall biosynthesis